VHEIAHSLRLTVVAEGVEQEEQAKMLRLLRRSNSVLGNSAPTIGTSMGIAVYPADASNADTLVKMADAAMYRAKQACG
jgi:GGDEF domain-containing protein